MTKEKTPEEFLKERGLRFKAQRDGLRLLPPGFNLVSLRDALEAVAMKEKQTTKKIFGLLDHEIFAGKMVEDGILWMRFTDYEKIKKHFLKEEKK